MTAPLLPEPLDLDVKARLLPMFCLFTSCPPLGSSDAGRFSADIVIGNMGNRQKGGPVG